MTDLVRINAEQDAVAAMPGLGSFELTLTPADVHSSLEAGLLFSSGGHIQFRDAAGHLVGELPAASVTIAACAVVTYEPGTGPLGICSTAWHSHGRTAAIPHTHECAHTQGHAWVGTNDHECACGATLPI